MENNGDLKKIVDRIQLPQIDEPAFLVISSNQIGVTDEIGDVIAFINNCQKENQAVQIIPGYKEALLDVQHRMLVFDEVENSLGKERMIYPKRMQGYNLVERTVPDVTMLTQLRKGIKL